MEIWATSEPRERENHVTRQIIHRRNGPHSSTGGGISQLKTENSRAFFFFQRVSIEGIGPQLTYFIEIWKQPKLGHLLWPKKRKDKHANLDILDNKWIQIQIWKRRKHLKHVKWQKTSKFSINYWLNFLLHYIHKTYLLNNPSVPNIRLRFSLRLRSGTHILIDFL